MLRQQLLTGTPPARRVLDRTDPRVERLHEGVQVCRASVRREGAHGYLINGTKCSGLTRRLSHRVLPNEKQHIGGPWYMTKRRGGSTRELGMRIDREIHHLINCIHDPEVDVQRLAAAGRPLPALERRERDNMPACLFCGLSGTVYGRRVPGWHRWTRAYLSDTFRYRLRLVASQVPVVWLPKRMATELDDLAIDSDGQAVVIERKTGYADATGTPRKTTKGRTVSVAVSEKVSVDLLSTQHTLHRLQAAIGLEMLQSTIPSLLDPKNRSCVAYVTGKSRAPPTAGRDTDGTLECVWLWDDEALKIAAALVGSTL